MPQKGIEQEDLPAIFFLQCVAELGYQNAPISVKNDQEPALVSVIRSVVNKRSARTLLEESPTGSSQSNGSIESAVSNIEGQI